MKSLNACKYLFTLVTSLTVVGAANAATITVTNPGFDYTTWKAANPASTNTNTGGFCWGANDTASVAFYDTSTLGHDTARVQGWYSDSQGASAGSQYVLDAKFWSDGNNPGTNNAVGFINAGSLKSTAITGALQANRIYTLSATLYEAAGFWPGDASIGMALLDGSGTTLPGGSLTITDPTASGPGNMVYTVTTAANQVAGDLQIYVTCAKSQLEIDNVSLSYSAVPEPGTFALLVAGVFGLAAYARRKRK
jgi:hypothetical protein